MSHFPILCHFTPDFCFDYPLIRQKIMTNHTFSGDGAEGPKERR